MLMQALLDTDEQSQRRMDVADAVVLIGGLSNWLYPLSRATLRALMPVGNEPLIFSVLRHLAAAGVRNAYIPLSPQIRQVRDVVGDGAGLGLTVHYVNETRLRGTGGCLRFVRDQLHDKPFFIVNGNCPSSMDLTPLLKEASSLPEGRPYFILGVPHGCKGKCDRPEAMPGAVLPATATAAETLPGVCSTANIYLTHPKIFDDIPEEKYFDLREQFLPEAAGKGYEVRTVPLRGEVNHMRTLQDYLKANLRVAEKLAYDPNVSQAKSVVARTATFQGPVLIGENARIGAHAVIVGPAVIGPDCVVERGAVVTQSVLEAGSHVGAFSHVKSSILLRGARVKRKQRIVRTAVFDGVRFPTGHDVLLEHAGSAKRWRVHTAGQMSFWRVPARHLYAATKRVMDLSVTLSAAPVVLPACLFLGALVKITSKGPMFYREKRVGHGGKEFHLCKLRTMYQDAHLRQGQLRKDNQSDGPMFKIIDDPRITPLGKWLRSKALDELPQFWNVFMGDMSLVGPRPLATREMKWHPAWKELRQRVKPGMTGLWQVWGGGVSKFSDWIDLDIKYVQESSLLKDIKILARTALVVFMGRRP